MSQHSVLQRNVDLVLVLVLLLRAVLCLSVRGFQGDCSGFWLHVLFSLCTGTDMAVFDG